MSEWISVEDELPKPGQEVIAYRPTAEESGDKKLIVQKYIGPEYKNRSWQGVVHGFSNICHPSHWQPIPDPPKQEAN